MKYCPQVSLRYYFKIAEQFSNLFKNPVNVIGLKNKSKGYYNLFPIMINIIDN